jgi:hypothetical protein
MREVTDGSLETETRKNGMIMKRKNKKRLLVVQKPWDGCA